MRALLKYQASRLASFHVRCSFLKPPRLRFRTDETFSGTKVLEQSHRATAKRFNSTTTTKQQARTSPKTEAAYSTGFREALRNFMLQPRTLPVPRWISPKYYTTTLSEICGHSSFLLVAISYAVDDFLQLRIIAVAGSAVMLCFTFFHPHGRVLWLPFKWNALFIAINSYRIGKSMMDKYFAAKLSPEMLEIHQKHFYILDLADFARLVRIGHVERFEAGQELCGQGELNRNIRLVIDGTYNVLRDGQVTYLVEEGNFLSETGLHAGLLLPGKVESCCSIVAATPGHTMCWERNELMDLLHREKGLRRALKAALSWDIVRKLKGQRLLLASGIVQDPDRWTQRRTEQGEHRYAAILQNMLAHPKYLKERKEELEKYRLIHHIDDEKHEMALARNGWTMENFERGYKTGEEPAEEDDSKHDLHWVVHDVYMRLFG